VTLTRAAIEERARRLIEGVSARAGDALSLGIVPGLSLPGGGSAPEEGLPTALVSVTSGRLSARAIEERLRAHATPVVVRIEAGKVLLDLRTVLEEQEPVLASALASLA